ncbi:hypothetical protein AQJ46_39770 [Streptomyces canus]|uniref:Uncharacterized protein n=1 Tax=Streptomyces canus TaxID=58343 RepID=A0A101RPK0_9ACTN|nr:hypothetical protein [Streptomyces canus]KUN59377.1 hypothetical protein AQJ46_39770 [Streptomyces canus]
MGGGGRGTEHLRRRAPLLRLLDEPAPLQGGGRPGRRSKAYAKGGVLVPSEHHIGEFHTWLQNKLEVRLTR